MPVFFLSSDVSGVFFMGQREYTLAYDFKGGPKPIQVRVWLSAYG